MIICSMPFADPEKQKEYFKRYNANRRWADTSEEFKEKARAKALSAFKKI